MKISARNVLKGKIIKVTKGAIRGCAYLTLVFAPFVTLIIFPFSTLRALNFIVISFKIRI